MRQTEYQQYRAAPDCRNAHSIQDRCHLHHPPATHQSPDRPPELAADQSQGMAHALADLKRPVMRCPLSKGCCCHPLIDLRHPTHLLRRRIRYSPCHRVPVQAGSLARSGLIRAGQGHLQKVPWLKTQRLPRGLAEVRYCLARAPKHRAGEHQTFRPNRANTKQDRQQTGGFRPSTD